MTEKIKTYWRRNHGRPWVLFWVTLLAVGLGFGVWTWASDADNDGMSDGYEMLFGLDPESAADAALDNDADAVTNLQESALGTDPFFADTDRDGWADGADSNPVSRAHVDWGDPDFTQGSNYWYAAPAWWLGAFRQGGEWLLDPPTSWHVPASESNEECSLEMVVDRSLLTNDLMMSMAYFDHSGATLYMDLLDADGEVVATNVFGNLLGGSDQAAAGLWEIPLESYPSAEGISLRRESGEVTVYTNLFYVDRDHDGLDAEQESQLGTSDTMLDSDGDGLTDADEVNIHGTDPARADTDGDGLSDGAEVNTHLTDPLLADTDFDGLMDGWEVQQGFNPVGLRMSDVGGWWKLDEPSGSQAFDASPNGNVGNISGAARISGASGYALRFDGVDDEVAIANSASYKPAALTVSLAARFSGLFGNQVSGSAADGTMVLLAQRNGGGGFAYALSKTSRHGLVFEMATGAGETSRVATVDGLVTTGKWYHVVCAYDGTQAVVYVNGQNAGSAECSLSLDYASGTGLLLGHGGLGDDGWLLGDLDDVLVLDRACAPSEAGHVNDGIEDTDNDGLSNVQEADAGTDPRLADGDGDGLTDAQEVAFGSDPYEADSDFDGLSDWQEIMVYGTDPRQPDSDFDGLSDLWELVYGRNPTNLPAGTLAGYWKLDETNGVDVRDSSPTPHDGTASGAAIHDGLLANARLFDGDDDYVSIANSALYKPASALTLATFINLSDLFGNTVGGSAPEGTMIFLAQKDAGSGYGYRLYKTSKNALVFELANGGSTGRLATADGFIATGKWYRVVATYDGSGMSLFANGTLLGSCAYAGGMDYSTATGLRMGSGGGTAEGYFKGLLDEVRVYGSALPPNDVLTLEEAVLDGDADGFDNYTESLFGTDPERADSDGDGLSDWDEVMTCHTDPARGDTDGDRIPDGWEAAHGMDPNQGSDGVEDPDSDGLTNYEEYVNETDRLDPDTDSDGLLDGEEVHDHRTNPLLADSDGDGIPDKWEIENGLNPNFTADGQHDPDEDGLLNYYEYLADTDPFNPDTDSDGANDHLEFFMAMSDPLTADFDGSASNEVTVTDIVSVMGSDTTNWVGTWVIEGNVIYSRTRCGYVDYVLDVPTQGIYALKVEGTQRNSLTVSDRFDIWLSVDGVYAGHQYLKAAYGQVGKATYFLPALEAGPHIIRLDWKNMEPNTFLQINSITLQTYGGLDLNSNGIADWQEHRQDRVSSFDLDNATSLVSPVCLEGFSFFQDMLQVAADYAPEGATSQVIAVKHGLGSSWYADVLLSPTNATLIQVLDQNGAVSYTNNVTWEALNLLDNPYTNTLLLRLDDSLKLAVFPTNETEGAMAFSVYAGSNLVTNGTAVVGGSFVHCFDQSGLFTVNGSYSNGYATSSTSMSVKVLSASFAGDPVCVVGQERTWDCPNVPTNVAIEHDAALQVGMQGLAGGGLRFSLLHVMEEPLYVVARVCEDGAILDSAEVSALTGDNGSYWRVVETYPDGSRVIEIQLRLGEVADDISVALNISAGGVVFEDGTLHRTLTASDFNEIGVATYRLIQSAEVMTSVCHGTSIYQGAQYIGGN